MRDFDTFEYDQDFADSMLQQFNQAYSDKGSFHNYQIVYSHLLKDMQVSRFLEIGLFLNDLPHTDLNAWAFIFPDAEIYGLDNKKAQLFNADRITMHFADQSDPGSLVAVSSLLPSNIDVILDDASHIYGNTVATFEALYPLLRTGGLYLIEDILDSRPEGNDWQQTVEELEAHMLSNGFTYEIYQSREPQMAINEETGEPMNVAMPSDDYVLCVFK